MKHLELFNEINKIKTELNDGLVKRFNLIKVQAPLILGLKDGIDNDVLGFERSITFDARHTREVYKVLQSASKWKRIALKKYDFPMGTGLLTETIAIRRDAKISKTSSLLWDELTFEFEIESENRNEDFLLDITKDMYEIICRSLSRNKKLNLPENIKVFTPQQLEDKYYSKTPKQREEIIGKEEGAFILIGIGHKLDSGIKHASRPFDTEDWNLNAEIIVWHEKSQSAMTVATASISVSERIMKEQAYATKEEDKLQLPYHQKLVNGELSPTIGGSIFESRVLMAALDKEHIGEVQVSVWQGEENNNLL